MKFILGVYSVPHHIVYRSVIAPLSFCDSKRTRKLLNLFRLLFLLIFNFTVRLRCFPYLGCVWHGGNSTFRPCGTLRLCRQHVEKPQLEWTATHMHCSCSLNGRCWICFAWFSMYRGFFNKWHSHRFFQLVSMFFLNYNMGSCTGHPLICMKLFIEKD